MFFEVGHALGLDVGKKHRDLIFAAVINLAFGIFSDGVLQRPGAYVDEFGVAEPGLLP